MSRTRKLTVRGIAVLGVVAGVLLSAVPVLADEGLGITAQFGAPGSGAGELSLVSPGGAGRDVGSGVAVNSTGEVYVADTSNNRVEWFAPNATTKVYEYAGQLNGSGLLASEHGKKAPAPLSEPEGIAVDNDPASPSFGDVYVVDRDGTVDKFSATGEFLFELPTAVEWGPGTPSERGAITSVAIDPSGNVWVITHQFATALEFSNAIENALVGTVVLEGYPFASGLAVDSEDNLYIPGGQKYSKTGVELGVVCNAEGCPDLAIGPVTDNLFANDLFVDTGTEVVQYGPFGEPFEAPIHVSRSNIFTTGAGIAVNPTNHEVYVAETASDHIDVLGLGPSPEAPETLKAEPVAATTATLKGKLTPHSPQAKLEYYFEYNLGAGCTGGSTTPVKEGEGAVSGEVTGLEPSAEYTYCLVAENGFGPEAGPPETLHTASAPPEVLSESAVNIGEHGGIFSAVINPNNSTQETTYFFEYSTKGSGETLEEPETVAGEGTVASGEFGERTVSSEEASLPEVAGTYYYRVVTTNGNGSPTVGKVQSYTKLPTVISEESSALTLTEATLEAVTKVNYQPTEYHFEYSTNKEAVERGEGTGVPGGKLIHSYEEEAQSIEVVLGDLTPDTPYYYRVVAENSSTENPSNADKGAPVEGEIKEFTTRTLPFVSTGGAQDITRTTATLSGTVTPRFLDATYYFAYIDQAGYEKALAGDAEEKADPYAEGETTTPIAIDASESAQAVGPLPAAGLLPGTTYHYALVSKNEFGSRYGEDHTFTTFTGTPPIVSTGSASAISQDSVTLSGTVSTNSLQTEYGFEIATEPEHYGPATGLGSIGGAATQAVSVTLGELRPGTTYYYRVTATNADGTIQGQPQSFTTPGFPTLIAPPASPPLIATPNIAFPEEEKTSGTTTKTLTNKEKRAKALKTCKKDKSKGKRVKCEKRAKKKYPTTEAKKKK